MNLTLSIAIGAIALVSFVLIGRKTKKQESAQPDDENDELVFDETKGKYVTVEELVKEQNLNLIDETKLQEIHSNLSVGTKAAISLKDLENILDFHHNLEALKEEEGLDMEAKTEMIKEAFKRKGKFIEETAIAEILEQIG